MKTQKKCKPLLIISLLLKEVLAKLQQILGRRTFLQQVVKDSSEGITRIIWLDILGFFQEVYSQVYWSQFQRSSADWWIHLTFNGRVHNSIYNNTDFLQIECFKFAFFPVIQKVLENIKDNWNSFLFENHSSPPMKANLLVDGIHLTQLRKILVSISLTLALMTCVQ